MNGKPRHSELAVASRNPKKIREITDLLVPFGIEVVGVADLGEVPQVVEDGRTFGENAAKKASQTAKFLARWVLGEDSGLMADALEGAPGVYSARYSGDDATDLANNAKLVAELNGVPVEQRGAGYVCNVALSDRTGRIRLQVEAGCRGRIITEARGANGFGYDPYFLIPEYHRTFGELSPLVKQQLSHRARAFAKLIPGLVRLVREEP